jgi:pSer/pThr/pTyr-binding forkhead associated (FHA) protein
MLVLKVNPDSPEERLEELAGGELIEIGRKPSPSGLRRVILTKPEVSGRHAEISGHGQFWTVRDCGSTNGTLLNQCRLTPGKYYRLELNDQLSICEQLILIESCPAYEAPKPEPLGGHECQMIPARIVESLREGRRDVAESEGTFKLEDRLVSPLK